MTTPAYTRYFWGKSDREDPQRIHLLEHHMADVGACFEALLAQPIIRQRLARSGGRDALDAATIARLCVFAALHDIGKVNVGFQARIWQDADWPEGETKRPFRSGHIADLTPVLNYDDRKTAAWFFDALGWDDFLTWDDEDGRIACGLFVAALSHHGAPLHLGSTRQPNSGIWHPYGNLHPQQHVTHIGRLVREWFPAAWSSVAPPLPAAVAFQHTFTGLCMLADWIGSDETCFPFRAEPDGDYMQTARANARRAVSDIGLNLEEQRSIFLSRPTLPGFDQLFSLPNARENAIQQAVTSVPPEEHLVIVESETGSGKTEAALLRFARLYEKGLVDGLYFALPTRAAASQIHRRVTAFTRNLFPTDAVLEPVLAVPGYVRAGDATGERLPNYEVWWDDHPDVRTEKRRWAAERAKRYLAAQIAVGTVDQAMMAVLQVKHAHMRAACLARNLLVVDEVHASDTYMSTVLEHLLRAHVEAGGYAMLMSATLGSVARCRWLDHNHPVTLADALATPYPAVSTPKGITAAGENDYAKTVALAAAPVMSDFADTARRALEAARAGAKVLVVRNTVGHAVQTQQALEELVSEEDAGFLFSVNDITTLHHGRFATGDRRLLDDAVEALLGKNRQADGRIVVGTQTLEQSLDIDADLLITDLCPVDVLLQRIGRLHRHRRDDRPAGYDMPTCAVLTPGDDLSPLLTSGQNANGLGPHGHVYGNLQILEATRRLIDEHPEWRIPAMNRELVERATHPDMLESITKEMGETWRAHANSTEGGYIGDRQTARSNVVRLDKSFFEDNRDVVFGSAEERIRTRLGDDRIDVAFDPLPVSPFEPFHEIDKLAVSADWLKGQEVPEAVETAPIDGGFEFSIGSRRFRYDRLGLRRV